MNTQQPNFDAIDEKESETLPRGLAFAYGFDSITGAQYYGLVEVDDNNVIKRPRAYVAVPYCFDLNDTTHADFEDVFVDRIVNDIKQAV